VTGKLVVLRGERPGTEFNLMGPRAVVGRAEFADIVIVDRAASRQHFEIVQDPGGFTLRDLNSGNGTYLNGQRIREAELVSGDRIQVGTHELNFLQLSGAHRDINRRRIVPLAVGANVQPPTPVAAEPRSVGPAVRVNVPRQNPMMPVQSAPVMQPPGPVAPPPGYGGPIPAPLPAVRPGGPRRRTSPITIIAILAFSLIALGLAAVIGWQLYERAKTAEPTPEEIASEYVQRGDEAVLLLDLAGATSQYEAALRVQPGNAGATAGLTRVRVESRWRDLMSEVEGQAATGQYARALILLRDVQSGSDLYGAAAAERLSALVATLLEHTRAAIDTGDYVSAWEHVRVALDADPTNPTALALLDELNARRARPPMGAASAAFPAMAAVGGIPTSTVGATAPGALSAGTPPPPTPGGAGAEAAPSAEVAAAEAAPSAPPPADPPRPADPSPRRESQAAEVSAAPPAPAPTPTPVAASPPEPRPTPVAEAVPEPSSGFRSTAPSETPAAAAPPAIQPFDDAPSPTATAAAAAPAPPPAAAAEAEAEVEPSRSARRSRDDDEESSGSRGFGRGWRYYDSGRFDDAMSFFAREASSGSGDEADQARAYAGFIDEFRTSWESGRSAYDAGEYDLAVRDLRLALRRDSRLNEHYQGEIRGMLAESYYRLAQSDYDRERFEDAGRRAQAALGYDSDHQGARRLLRELDDVANRLYIQARGFRDSDPERARQLCRDIQQMLPESSDFYQRATELLDSL
jgi:tetratricopeptide (TPR) repeat protein